MTDRCFRRRTVLAMGAALAAPLPGLRAFAQDHPVPSAGPLPDDLVQSGPATVTRLRSARPLLALTFDDGPHPILTDRLLAVLASRGVSATFYLIGSQVARFPDVARRIAAAGHEIGNHSWSHPDLSLLDDAALLSEIDRTNGVIGDAVGRAPVTLRPPYGLLEARQRRLVHAERGMPTVLWSVDPRDWRRPGPEEITRRILTGSHPGGVVLAHDILSGTVDAMPATLDVLLARGYRFVTLCELLGWPRWSAPPAPPAMPET